MCFLTKNNISLIELIFYSIIPYGPLYARVFNLNGSLDKKYYIRSYLSIYLYIYLCFEITSKNSIIIIKID